MAGAKLRGVSAKTKWRGRKAETTRDVAPATVISANIKHCNRNQKNNSRM
jgi:hypothetical protein